MEHPIKQRQKAKVHLKITLPYQHLMGNMCSFGYVLYAPNEHKHHADFYHTKHYSLMVLILSEKEV